MSRFKANLGGRRERGILGNLIGSLFFLVFGGLGALFTLFLGMQVYRDVQTYKWPTVPCTILESGVTDKGGNSPYQVQVHYQYQWQNQTYTSQQLAIQPKTFSDYSEAQRLVDRFRSDSKATCYVDPGKPSDAILQRNPLWTAFFMLIPLVFVFIGIGGLYIIWRKVPASPSPSTSAKTMQAMHGKKFSLFFWLAFLVIGSIVFSFIIVRPAIKTVQARDWNAVPCTVISSRVKSHNSDDGTTYSVDILYSYEIDGREYKANRYTFLGGSSSGRSGKQKVVNQHPPGAKKICYVNPADPTDAVLHRGLTPTMLFGLIPLLFIGIGLLGVIGTLRKAKTDFRKEQLPRGPAPLKIAGRREHTPSMPVELKSKASPRAKFIAGVCISIFWNGIVSVFVFQIVQMWRTGDNMKWFLSLFMIPFVLIGLGMIAFAIHSFFGLFSPRVRVRASHAPVALGESIELSWEFSGRVHKLRDICLVLEGREEQDEGSGKRRRTNTNVFYTADIAHFTNVNDVKTGTVLCTIPTDHSPSDPDGDHRIVWVIRLKAQVEMGADLDDEYPIEVVSAAAHELASG